MTKSRKPTAKDKEAWGMVYGVLMGVYGIWPIRPYDCRSHSADCCSNNFVVSFSSMMRTCIHCVVWPCTWGRHQFKMR